jgi:polyisoprenoid-binding protein YceI
MCAPYPAQAVGDPKAMKKERSVARWRGLGDSLMLAALIVGLSLCGARAVEAATYTFVKDYTSVRFSWSHLGLSRQSARVMDFDGTVEFEPDQPEASRVDVLIKASSLRTGVPAFDDLLKSVEYFDAQRNPTIRFRSTSARRMSDRTGELTGDLTVMGITKPVTLYVVWNFTGEHPLAQVNPNYKDVFVAGFSATGVLRRSDWGLSRAVPLVSDEIELTIETELLRR